MSGDAQADNARLRARVAELRDAGLTYRAISAELGIAPSCAWKYHEQWIRELRRGSIDLQQRAEQAIREQHEMIRTERERLEMERDAAAEVLTARHLTISNGHIVSEITGTDDDGKPIYGDPLEDDGPVLAVLDRLQAIRDRLLKLADHEAKLLGLYAKTEVSHTGGVTYRILGVSPEELT